MIARHQQTTSTQPPLNKPSKPKLLTSLRPAQPPAEPSRQPPKTWKTVNTLSTTSNAVSPQFNPISPPNTLLARPRAKQQPTLSKPTEPKSATSPQPRRHVAHDRYSTLAHTLQSRSHSASTNVSGNASPYLNAVNGSVTNSPVQIGDSVTSPHAQHLSKLLAIQRDSRDGDDTSQDGVSGDDVSSVDVQYSAYDAVLSSIKHRNIQSSIETLRPRLPSTSSENSNSHVRRSTSQQAVPHQVSNVSDSESLNGSSSDDDSGDEDLVDEDSDDDTQTAHNGAASSNRSIYQRVLSLDRAEPTSVAIERRKKWRKFGDAAADGTRLYRTDVSQSIRDQTTGLLLSLAPLPPKPTDGAGGQASEAVTTVGAEIELKLFPQKLHSNTDTAIGALGKDLTALLTNTSVIKCSNCGVSGHYARQCKQPRKRHSSTSTNESTGPVTDNSAALPTSSSRRSGVLPSNVTDVQINNLPTETTKQDVHDLCAYFGRVKRVTVPVDRYGQARGIAYVAYMRSSDAATAIQQLNRHTYGGCILAVAPAMQY